MVFNHASQDAFNVDVADFGVRLEASKQKFQQKNSVFERVFVVVLFWLSVCSTKAVAVY